MSDKNKIMKNIPKLRFPEFKDAPEWEEMALGLLSLKISDGIHATPFYDDYGDYYFINGNNLINGVIVVDEKTKRVTEQEYQKHKRDLNQHTILLSINGTIGNISVYNSEKVILGKSACYININNKKANKQFLINFLKTLKVQNFFNSELTGSTIKNLSLKTIKKTKIDLPSLSEQQKIADCLNVIDELITAQIAKVEALKEHKKGLMQQLFPQDGETVPRLRFPEFKNATEWEEKTLGKICEILNNRRMPISSNNREHGSYPYYGASGIVDYVKDYIFNERLLLIGEDGAKWGAFENTAFIAEEKYWVNNHAHVLKPLKINDIILQNYLNMLDITPFITGAAPPKLTLNNLKNITVLVPLFIKEQQKIADCLSSIDELITAQTAKVKTLKEHKKGLMQQLFPSTRD